MDKDPCLDFLHPGNAGAVGGDYPLDHVGSKLPSFLTTGVITTALMCRKPFAHEGSPLIEAPSENQMKSILCRAHQFSHCGEAIAVMPGHQGRGEILPLSRAVSRPAPPRQNQIGPNGMRSKQVPVLREERMFDAHDHRQVPGLDGIWRGQIQEGTCEVGGKNSGTGDRSEPHREFPTHETPAARECDPPRRSSSLSHCTDVSKSSSTQIKAPAGSTWGPYVRLSRRLAAASAATAIKCSNCAHFFSGSTLSPPTLSPR